MKNGEVLRHWKVGVTLFILVASLLVVMLHFVPFGEATSYLVGTSTRTLAVDWPCQRKGFFASGLYWLFTSDGSNMIYKTSADGSSWSSAITVKVGVDDGTYFSIWYDGTFLHYGLQGPSDYLTYRRGTPNGGGTITWSAVEQNVVYVPNIQEAYPFVSVDTSGCAWITFTNSTGSPPYPPMVTKSSKTDGTWTTDSGFPCLLTEDSATALTSILPMSNNRMYAIYCASSPQKVKGKLWNGTAWEDQENASLKQSWGTSSFSAVVDGNDNVHLVYTQGEYPDGYLNYRKRVFASGWEATETTLQTSYVGNFYPYATMSLNEPNLYVFWRYNNTAIHYKRQINGIWDVEPLGIETEPVGNYDNKGISGFYSGRGFAFSTGTAAPYSIYFYIPISCDSFVVLNTPTDGTTTYTNLQAFTYTPVFYEVIDNSSIWANISGIWQRLAWNSSAITSNTLNSISYSFTDSGTYIWNIALYNSTHRIFAESNRTLTKSLEPRYSNLGHSTTVVERTCTFTSLWKDGDGLSGSIFSWNYGIGWLNNTWLAFSGSPTEQLATASKTLPSEANVVVLYMFYGNDTDDKWTVTDIGSLTTTEPPPPSWNVAVEAVWVVILPLFVVIGASLLFFKKRYGELSLGSILMVATLFILCATMLAIVLGIFYGG